MGRKVFGFSEGQRSAVPSTSLDVGERPTKLGDPVGEGFESFRDRDRGMGDMFHAPVIGHQG